MRVATTFNFLAREEEIWGRTKVCDGDYDGQEGQHEYHHQRRQHHEAHLSCVVSAEACVMIEIKLNLVEDDTSAESRTCKIERMVEREEI